MFLKGNGGVNLYYDVVMLPELEFVRMKSNIGLQVSQAPKMGTAPQSVFTLSDARYVSVPEEESNPVSYAKNHFMAVFGLTAPESQS